MTGTTRLSLVAIMMAVAVLLTPPNALAQNAPAATATMKAAKAPSAAQVALRERQKKCGAEWKQAKAAGKVEKGMKWPQYWSACNKRLKAAGG